MADARVALVTGGGTGIGAAAARLLARRGATVALVGRRLAALEDVARTIEAEGGRALPVVGDLATPDGPAAVVERTLAEAGGLDVLVNNAGSMTLAPFGEFAAEAFDAELATNVRAPFLLCQAALPALRRSPAPVIVNVSSVTAVMARPGQALYGLTKAALEHLTRQLASELAADGIRVNCVRPGPADTELNQSQPDYEARVARLRELVPLGRLGQPEEIAWWIAQLAEPEAAWTTGAIITVDGGRRLGPPRLI